MLNMVKHSRKSKMLVGFLLAILLSGTATRLPLGFAYTAAAQEGDAKSETIPQSVSGLQACQEGMALSQGEGCYVSGSATRVVVGSTSACLAFFEPALLLVCHAAQIDSSTVVSADSVGDGSWIIENLTAEPGSCGELRAIHDAVRLGRADWVTCLASTDVDLNACDDEDTTPLSIAAEKGSKELAQILVAAGADVNALNCFGESPLQIVLRNDDAEVVQILVAAGAEEGGSPFLQAEGAMEADDGTEELLSLVLLYVALEKSGELDAAITQMTQEFVSSLAESFSEEDWDIEAQALGDTSLNIVIEEIVRNIVKYLLPDLAAEGVDTGSEDEVTEFLMAVMSGGADIEAGIAELRSIGLYGDTTADAIRAFVHNYPAGLAQILVAASAGVAVEDPIKFFSKSFVTDLAGILVSAGSEVDPAALGETPLQAAVEYIISETLRVFLPEQFVRTLIASSGLEDDKARHEFAGLFQNGESNRDFRIMGDAPLFDAIAQGDPEIVRLLVEAGADVNAADGFDGNTALHEAVENGDVEMVKILVAAGADVEAEGFMSRTPLSLAAEEGATEIMQILLSPGPDADTSADGEDKEAPSTPSIGSEALYTAIEKGNVEMVRLLVEAGADVNAAEGFGGRTPLLDAIEQGDHEIVRLLVKAGADVDAAAGFGGNTALHEAVENGDVEMVKILVAAGADVEAVGFMSRTPLSLAAEEGATEIMQILLEQGPDTDTSAGDEDKEAPTESAIGSEALYTAIEKGTVEMVRLLVEGGADVNATEGFGGRTPLLEAIEQGNHEIVRLLVEAGADVDAAAGFGGNTALHEAVENGDVEMVKILVAAGADVEAVGFMSRTPLSLAAEEGATEIMQILLGPGPDADTSADGEDKEAPSTPSIGSEALYTAIENGDQEMVRLLVEGGADVNATEGFGGSTPLLDAIEEGEYEIARLLVEAGADVNAAAGFGGNTALHEAVEKGDVEIVKILVAAGADVEAVGFMNRTPLSLAAEEGATEIMRILLGLDGSTETSEN